MMPNPITWARGLFKKDESALVSAQAEIQALRETMESHAVLLKAITASFGEVAQSRQELLAKIYLLEKEVKSITELDIHCFKQNPDAYDLEKAHEQDACWDIFAVEDITIPSRERGLVETGLVIAFPSYYECVIRGRSSLNANTSKPRMVKKQSTVGLSAGGPEDVKVHLVEVDVEEAFPKDLTLHVGTCDAGYRKTYKVVIENGGSAYAQIRKGDKIAQLAFRFKPKKERVHYHDSLDDLPSGDRLDGWGTSGSGQKSGAIR